MANPRIDELRKRLDREPGSRLFGQLAEELRKDGDLPEAIRVARTGLAAHPNYPSARMTLGRALFDTGNLAAARVELELVLRGASDNILASRMLAECLEGLGDLGAALLQYRAASRLAPGDRQTELQIRALEQRLAGPGGPRPGPAPAPAIPRASHAPPAPQAPQARPPSSPPPVAMSPAPSPTPRSPGSGEPSRPVAPRRPVPDPAADFDDVFETAPSWQRAPTASAAPEGEAILLLEDEAPTLPVAPRAPEAAPVAPRPDTMAFDALPPIPPPAPLNLVFEPAPAQDEHLSFEEPIHTPAAASDSPAGTPAFPSPPPSSPARPAPSAAAPALPRAEPAASAPVGDSTAAFAAFSAAIPPPEAAPVPEPVPAVTPTVAEAPALSTSTLAELYFDQGFPDKAVQVYDELLEREPQNERARVRLIEITSMSQHPAQAALPEPRPERRLLLERKIARLEEMLAAVRRG